jgi:hypothetical protein
MPLRLKDSRLSQAAGARRKVYDTKTGSAKLGYIYSAIIETHAQEHARGGSKTESS